MRSAVHETSVNIENAPSGPNPIQPGKGSRGSLDAESDESTQRRVQVKELYEKVIARTGPFNLVLRR